YAALGNAIENGFKLYVQEHGGKLAGREIQYFKVDDESEPSKGTDNVNKLIKRDNVDVLVGTVHSGVALAMARAAKENNTLLIIPNAGADAIYAFFAGGGAVKFVKDYAAAGLNKTIPLYGPGFLTDGTLEAQGPAAQGLLTTLHYADNLDTPRNNGFRKSYALTYKANAD